jgi:hypothetical protein
MTEESSKIVSESSLIVDQWYVYAYSDPRPGRDSQRIYVGMGQTKHPAEARRMRQHWKLCERHQNKLFGRILAKIKRLGLEPLMEVIAIFSAAEEAKVEERRLIALYGKRIERTGTLCNVTGGGDGSFGLPPEFRAKAIEGVRRFNVANPEKMKATQAKALLSWTEERRNAHATKMTERLSKAEVRERISAGLKANPEFLKASAERIRKHATDPALLAKRNAAQRIAFDDPLLHAKLSRIGKAFWNSAEGQALKSDMMTKAWENPEYRAKMTAERSARWQNDQFVAKAKAGMKIGIAAMSPDAKAALADKRREAARKRWANPEWKANALAKMTTPENIAAQSVRAKLRWEGERMDRELKVVRAALHPKQNLGAHQHV